MNTSKLFSFSEIDKNLTSVKLFFIFSFVVFGSIIVVLSFYLNYMYQVDELKKQISININKEIENKTSALNKKLEIYKNELYSFSHNPIIKNYLLKPDIYNENTLSALFSHIISADTNIMQIRFLDVNGNEKIKYERDNLSSNSYIVSQNKLQNKSQRYYFKEASSLKENTIWVSDIDLNKEHGKIQTPYVPTIRFAMPIYDDLAFKGIVIYNVFMENILNSLVNSELYHISLIDENNEVLMGKIPVNGLRQNIQWTKFTQKHDDVKVHYTNYIDRAINNKDIHNIFIKNISEYINLKQKLYLIVETKKDKFQELENNMFKESFKFIGIVLIASIIIGFILAFVPISIANKLIKSREKLDETKLLMDEYLSAMDMNNIITRSDLSGNITYVNDNFLKVTGYTKEEVMGKPHSIIRSKESEKNIFKEMWETIQSKKKWRGILKNRKKDGNFYYVDIAIVPILDTNDEIIEYIGIRHDITELMLQKQKLFEIATKDSLTGCGNRTLLSDDIHEHEKNNLAVIDIDDYSSINDFYGHTIGDIVIKKFAELLSNTLDDKVFKLYRLHSEKFAILNSSLSQDEFTEYMTKLNKNMIDSIIDLGVKKFDIMTTVGISFEHNYEILLTAEIANKHAKKVSKHTLIYEKNLEIEKVFEENLTWISKIKEALLENRFLVHYQPIFNNKTKQIEKYEALVRLEDKDGTIIAPNHFLPIAKRSKQYINITKKVMDITFEKFKESKYEFSINLTVEDVSNKEVTDYLMDKIQEYKIGNRVVLELVESENIENFEKLYSFIKLFKSKGCKVAIDDFGTGYSNFEYLIKIDADYVKIDGSMIKDINRNENTKEIVKTIVEFTKKMNFKTVAEYVSNDDIQEVVNELGIDYSQGFYIGKPMDDIER